MIVAMTITTALILAWDVSHVTAVCLQRAPSVMIIQETVAASLVLLDDNVTDASQVTGITQLMDVCVS